MRHAIAVVSWAACALLMLTTPTANAQQRPKKTKKISVHKCMSYTQTEYESGLFLTLTSECEPRVSCDLRWKLKCDGSKPKSFTESFSLDTGDSRQGHAEATSCGDAGWSITAVKWSCVEEKDNLVQPAA